MLSLVCAKATISAGFHASPVRPISLRAGAPVPTMACYHKLGACSAALTCIVMATTSAHVDASHNTMMPSLSLMWSPSPWSDLSVSSHCHIHAQRAQTMPPVVVPSVTPRRNTKPRVAS
jgi:hypothetical protein